MEFDAQDVMTRIAEEAGRARRPIIAPDQAPIAGGIASVVGRSHPIGPKPEYRLQDLLAYRDRAFVDAAFEVVLGRRPDAGERDAYLRVLRDGALSRVEILGSMRWSSEGLARGTHIDGLLVPYTLRRWSRRRWLGRPLAWLRSLLRLDAIAERADIESAAVARNVTELSDETREALGYLEAQLVGLGSFVQEAVARLDGIASARAGEEDAIARLRGDIEASIERVDLRCNAIESMLAAPLQQCATELEGLDSRFNAIESALAELDERAVERQEARLGALQSALAALDERANLLEHHVVAHGAAIEHARRDKEAENERSGSLDPLYVAFEAAFRGPEAIIRERFAPYLDVVRAAGGGTADRPILDIGSGGGEWLQLVKDHGLIASGIDMNRLFVELCRGRGLDVAQGDAIAELGGLGDSTRGAVTAMHVAEHLPFEQLVRLIDEAKRVLAPNGVLILETPNPENLRVGSNTFYLDPTHRNPLPPEMLRWVVAARGFIDVRIERLTTAREMPVPPAVPDGAAGAAAINTFVSMLAAAPDYAIIGRKP